MNSFKVQSHSILSSRLLTSVHEVCRIANHRPVDSDASPGRTLLLLDATTKQLDHYITSAGHLRLAGTGIVFNYRWNLVGLKATRVSVIFSGSKASLSCYSTRKTHVKITSNYTLSQVSAKSRSSVLSERFAASHSSGMCSKISL